MNSEITSINVEVETLNLENVKNDLLDYVDKNAKVDITESVKEAKKSASDAETSAINAANSAVLASEYASQTVADLEQYYSKTQADELLAGKANIANTLTGYGIADAYSKTQADELLAGKSSISLSNLSADGQMIIDTQNGTISNCILDIPQNIKLTLENNVLTLQAGSILTNSGSTYQTITTTEDKSYSFYNNATFVIFCQPSGAMTPVALSNCVSGTTDSLAGTAYHIWFDTTNKEVNYYAADGITATNKTYPICIITVDNHVASFAKDSNGRDMIFNGACFVGHHIVKYPNIKALVPKGLNTDGSMSSYNVLTASLEIIEMRTNINFCTITNSGSSQARVNYREVDELDNVVSSQYLKPQNLFYFYTGNAYVLRYETPFVFFTYNGSTVTQFDMVKPVRMATVEMMDKVEAEVKGKADNNSVVHINGEENINGNKAFYGVLFFKHLSNTSGYDGYYYQQNDGNLIQGLRSGTTWLNYIQCRVDGSIHYGGTVYTPTPAAGATGTETVNAAWVNTAISGKQNNITTITGYDATKTQTLKNVNGVLTWVDD